MMNRGTALIIGNILIEFSNTRYCFTIAYIEIESKCFNYRDN